MKKNNILFKQQKEFTKLLYKLLEDQALNMGASARMFPIATNVLKENKGKKKLSKKQLSALERGRKILTQKRREALIGE